MNTPVKVLFVEDSDDDVKLALRALRLGGFETSHRRVQTAADLEGALAGEHWDAVISDFSMPGFTGVDALRIVRAADLDIPFILVSGTVGEERAANAMKSGASDYVMKTNLSRLAPALERELTDAAMRADLHLSQAALAETSLRFRQMSDNIRDVFLLIDAATDRVLYVSPAYAEIWGRSRESLYASPDSWTEAIHPDDRAAAYEKCKAGMVTGRYQLEYRIVRPDGGIRWMESRGFPVLDASGKLERVAGVVTDVTERKASDDRIRRVNRVYAMLSGINSLIIRACERDDLFKEACRVAIEQGGFAMAWIGVVDRSRNTVIPAASEGMTDEFLAAVRKRFAQGVDRLSDDSLVARAIRDGKAAFSNEVQDAPGFAFKEEMAAFGAHSIAVLPLLVADEVVAVFTLFAKEAGFFDAGELELLTQLAGDIAFAIDHIDKQARLDYLAFYDLLTGLANRRLFLDRLAHQKRAALAAGQKLALVLVDLERFRNINDSLGRVAGDMLLRQVAAWLTSHSGDADLVARVGADQFAVVLPNAVAGGDAKRRLEAAIEEFMEHPFRLDEVELRVPVKVGIAVFPDDGTKAEVLFNNAEAALRSAKRSGERYAFYKQKMNEGDSRKLGLENQLRQALDKGEFVLHYQPKVSLATGKLTSAEALIRWNDPRTGLVAPGRFIPVLEETGMILEVGRWAMNRAIADYLRWRAAGLPALRVAVNVSPLQLRSRGFLDEIRRAVAVDVNAAAGLEIEITESVIMEDVQDNIASLKAIRDLGVTIAIDDFGTGFSSLAYLAKLPVDTLKIDRSFVMGMTVAPEGLSLVSTIINLAHSLKLKVVAEGVETEEQSRLLHLLNCDEMQGYLFSKPVPAEAFEAGFLAPAATLPAVA